MNNAWEKTGSFEAELQAALAVPPAPDFLRELRQRVQAAEPPMAPPRRLSTLRLVFTLGLPMLILAGILIAGPDRVLAALRSLIGYIPGIGYVDSGGGLRTFAAPAGETHDGVTLTMEQAVFDSQRSVLVFTVEGIPWSVRPASEDAPACLDQPTLQTAGGTILEPTGMEIQGWGSGYRERLVFAAVPVSDNNVILRVPCLTDTKPGTSLENWELTLQIVPAEADATVIPVLEIPTAMPAPAATETSSVLDGIRLQAERVVALEEGWRVEGAVIFDPETAFIYQPTELDLQLTDAAGRKIVFRAAHPDSAAEYAEGTQLWAMEIPAGDYQNPLTLEMTSIVNAVPASAEFYVDLGEHPEAGAIFPLDAQVDVNGESVLVRSLMFDGEPGGEGSYVLAISLPEDVIAVSVNTPDHPSHSGGGGGMEGEMRLSIGYDDLQAGRQRFVFDSIAIRQAGSWKTTFDLPGLQGANSAAPSLTEACLTSEKWNALAAGRPPLPAGLTGTLLVEGPAPTGVHFSSLFTLHPDGTGRMDLPPGGWADLGRDGMRAAYVDANGVHLHSLAYGGDSLVTDAGTNAYHPLLSPDGMRLAYMDTGGDPGLYLLWVDGHERAKVPGTDAWVSPAGWMPDGRRIVVTRLGADGAQVQTLDVETGRAEDGFAIKQAKGGFGVLSPQGDRVAFSEMAFGLPNYGVFTAKLDGSERQFVALLEDGMVAEAGAWSPDGAWLVVVGTSYADPFTPVQQSVLVNPDGCFAAPFPFEGAVRGWAR